jgi:hypothetical protein
MTTAQKTDNLLKGLFAQKYVEARLVFTATQKKNKPVRKHYSPILKP